MFFTKILTILLLAGAPEAAVPAPVPVACDPVEAKFVKIRYPAEYFDPAALKKLPENIRANFELDKVEMQQVAPDAKLEIADASPGVDRQALLEFLEWYAESVYSENEL